MILLTAVLGVFSLAVSLAYHNIADGDLWVHLAQGAFIWKTGAIFHKDIFAFTPVLSEYIDHEWGAGLIFFSLLKFFGPCSLLLLKMVIAIATIIIALSASRLSKVKWETLLILAIPVCFAILPAYAPVVRSYVFTYFFFSVTIFGLESMRTSGKWPWPVIPVIMFFWANIHGGFMAGIGIVFIYYLVSLIEGKPNKYMLLTVFTSMAVTLIGSPHSSNVHIL